jgi:type I restriction enzyme, R subunit
VNTTLPQAKFKTGGLRAKKLTADYVLVYKEIKLAVVEATSHHFCVA